MSPGTVSLEITTAYFMSFCFIILVYHFIGNGEFSSILTMAGIFECLALSLLVIQQRDRVSADGVSARSLALEGLSFACRLSSTMWLNGYLPVDASGDHIIQGVDLLSLFMVCLLLYRVLVTNRKSYDADADDFPAILLLIAAAVLGAIFHANMNSRPLFDSLWMVGLFLGCVAQIPQLYLIIRSGGIVQAFTGHYIAMTTISRLLSGIFMWFARYDVTCDPYIEGFNHAIWAILAAHLLHLLLLGDFSYYYLRAIMSHGLNADMKFPVACDIV